MLDVIKEVGAFAGLAAFLGLAALSLLYFIQARDVRRLREWAGGAPERDAPLTAATADVAAERAEELKRLEEERERKEDARKEQQRAASKRETRRVRREAGLPEETRRERIFGRFSGDGSRRLPEWRYRALIAGAVVVLGGGIAFGALQVFGGDDEGGGQTNGGSALRPGQIDVAVLNGTAVAGLADRTGDNLEADGFQLGTVTNSSSSFTASVIMFAPGRRPEAEEVGKSLGIRELRAMTSEIQGVAAGADVAVVVGEDRATPAQAE
jgi:hypothetical protein